MSPVTLVAAEPETMMPRYTIDLHNHTPLIPTDYRGDPGTSPRQIVERALALGIDALGIADHFSVEYGPLLTAAAEEVERETGRCLLVVPGAEVRVRHQGEETHLVCLFPPGSATEAFERLMRLLGFDLPVAPREELPYFAIERDPAEVARLVNELGGTCHIGHVDRAFGTYRFIDSELAHELAACEHISAIELIDPANGQRFGDGSPVARIASSDSHSLEEMGRRTAQLEMGELSFEALRQALREIRHDTRTTASGA